MKKSPLRVVRDSAGGVEIPAGAVIIASTDILRALLSEFCERGEAVYRDPDTNEHIFDGIPITPSGELPNGTFVILARGE